MIARSLRRSAVIGVALGADRIHAVRVRRNGSAMPRDSWSSPLDPCTPGSSGWTALEAAVTEMRAHYGASCTLHVALLPSLLKSRLVHLPKISTREAEHVLTRDVARYFVLDAEPQAVALHRASAEAGRRAWIASVAADDLVEAIECAVDAIGWRLGRLVPAWAALHAWRQRSHTRTTRPNSVIAHEGACAHLVRFHRRNVAEVRTVRQEMLPSPEEGTPVLTNDEAVNAVSAFCAHVRAPLLFSGARREAIRVTAQRSARLYLGAAVVLLLAAAGVDTWGVRRELEAVRYERAAHHASVIAAAASSSRLDSLRTRVELLRSARRSAPAWTTDVSGIARHLPMHSYLTRLDGRGDTVTLHGITRDAQSALKALDQSPRYESVRFLTPLETVEGAEAALQRFTIGMVVRPEGHP